MRRQPKGVAECSQGKKQGQAPQSGGHTAGENGDQHGTEHWHEDQHLQHSPPHPSLAVAMIFFIS